jgi:hypothetical protein
MPSQLLSDVASVPNLFIAWKKCKAYLRQHAWYYDPLEIDLLESDLEGSLRDISRQVLKGTYAPSPSTLVPAPKRIRSEDSDGKILRYFLDRPLADCGFADQVVWVGLVNHLADRFEDAFVSSDPGSVSNASYGNRLFRAIGTGGALAFSRTNSRLYRQYYKDYSNYLKQSLLETERCRSRRPVELFELDIKGFYDNIDSNLLLTLIAEKVHEPDVCALIERLLFCWELRDSQGRDVRQEGKGIPQGLAASGFLSNIYLTPLDLWARGQTCTNGSRLLYYSRYVDDIRVVVARRGRPSAEPRPIEEMRAFVGERLHLSIINKHKEERQDGWVWKGNPDSEPIREDQLATRVSQVDWMTSHLITPESAREVAGNLETLLYLDFEQVAMRRDSRLRFCVNRLVSSWRQFRDLDPEFWEQKAIRLREWLLSEWRADPSQRTLLLRLLELTPDGSLNTLIRKLLRAIDEMAESDGHGTKYTWQWYLRTCIYQYLHQRLRSAPCDAKGILQHNTLRAAVTKDLAPDRPWYLRRAAYRLASLWAGNTKSRLAERVRKAVQQSADADVRTAQLHCLYSWLPQSSCAKLLGRSDARGVDVLLFGNRLKDGGAITDSSVRALAIAASRGVPEFSRAVEVVTDRIARALRPSQVAQLAVAGVERAKVEISLIRHTSPHWRTAGRELAMTSWFAELSEAATEGFVPLAAPIAAGEFRDELRLTRLLAQLASWLTKQRAPNRQATRRRQGPV